MKCLVTKLNASVDNDSLKVIGRGYVEIINGGGFRGTNLKVEGVDLSRIREHYTHRQSSRQVTII